MNHDLHTHTTWSDGKHEIPTQIHLARAFQLGGIAFTDHLFPGQKLTAAGAMEAYTNEIEKSRKNVDDLVILKGVELMVLDTTGSVLLTENEAEKFEWILCDIGHQSEGTLKNTPTDKQLYAENVIRTYLALCDNPFINGIAHPFNTGNTCPALLPQDFPEVLISELASKMYATRTVFDVMNLTAFWFQSAGISPQELTIQYTELIRQFARYRVIFQVSSDDHRCGIGHLLWSQRVLEQAGVPDSQIVDITKIPLV